MSDLRVCPDCGELREDDVHLDTRQAACDPARVEYYTTLPVFGSYTRKQLSGAFDQVKNRENWKLPIDSVVPADANLDLIESAVIFYTGSVPEFVNKGEWLRVYADGYYNAIGS